jgi:hypothetical protein
MLLKVAGKIYSFCGIFYTFKPSKSLPNTTLNGVLSHSWKKTLSGEDWATKRSKIEMLLASTASRSAPQNGGVQHLSQAV